LEKIKNMDFNFTNIFKKIKFTKILPKNVTNYGTLISKVSKKWYMLGKKIN
jgi:hypothetical protein